MYISYDKNNTITAFSNDYFEIVNQKILSVDPKSEFSVGQTISFNKKKQIKDLRVAFVCNWGDDCGIATYSKYLVDAIFPKVKEIKIFAEFIKNERLDESYVERCWNRGKSTIELLEKITAYNPDLVIVQHEFGIFPKATYFLQFLQGLDKFPYVFTLHSVYEHLDKAVCTSAIKNIIVHTEEGKQILRKTGNNNNVWVIPHGCITIPEEERKELWNIFHTPYAIMQFGFGFNYKGVDTVLDALKLLKSNHGEKYKDVFYCYLCSENPHSANVHNNYVHFLNDKITENGLKDNVAIIRKYQSEQTINQYLRTAKLALFPYRSSPDNVVYGASGATRIAMANGTPCIVGKNHQFDDLNDVLPRAATAEELAIEIDKIFSDEKYKNTIIQKSLSYCENNKWENIADLYLKLYFDLLPKNTFYLEN